MNKRRRAITLIEVLTVMAVLSAVFSLILTALFTIQKSNRTFTAGVQQVIQQQRFITQLRNDAHQAQQARVQQPESDLPAATRVTLTVDTDQVVEYELHADRIERRLRNADEMLHHDSFHLSPVLQQGWTIDTSRDLPLLSLQLHQFGPIPIDQQRMIPLQVDTAVGINQARTKSSPSTLPRDE